MSGAAHRWISPEEYLALEAQADYKSEYYNGELFAMAGGRPEHSLILLNVGRHHYQTIPSLKEYLLVSTEEYRVEQFTRQADGRQWLNEACARLDGALELPSLNCELPLSIVYHKVTLTPAAYGQRPRPSAANRKQSE